MAVAAAVRKEQVLQHVAVVADQGAASAVHSLFLVATKLPTLWERVAPGKLAQAEAERLAEQQRLRAEREDSLALRTVLAAVEERRQRRTELVVRLPAVVLTLPATTATKVTPLILAAVTQPAER